MQSRRVKKIVAAAITLVGLGFSFIYFIGFRKSIIPAQEGIEILIQSQTNFEDLISDLKSKQCLGDEFGFRQMSKILSFGNGKLKEGRYTVTKAMSNIEFIKKLRAGKQDAVKLKINNVRDIEQLCGKLGDQLMVDSVGFAQRFLDTVFLDSLQYKKETFLCLFIPNTYEVYWNIKPEKLIERMKKEHESFWSKENRLQLIAEKNLNADQAYTLASIVEKETNNDGERARIAGVYLNRLKSGMKLQADPTVVFALGLFGAQRILFEHLSTPSPYNTYYTEGIPPGPIYMPSLSSLEAVIHAEEHDYLFFCAKPGYDGTHVFATNLSGHAQNANQYRKWLDEENIK
ncbi:MAG TPA: endolytic transglycosylase MltG [Saprospiraceae bacterium]|nr:endolytic transglycosylase MltG [Saprospiraceae bacterium]